MLTIRELRSDDEITSAFPLMAALRDRIRADTFLREIRRQQVEGYELIGAFDGGRLAALAGVRRSHTLARGEHLFVDDLVTAMGTGRRSCGGWRSALMRKASRGFTSIAGSRRRAFTSAWASRS
jgi:hypothetical protein